MYIILRSWLTPPDTTALVADQMLTIAGDEWFWKGGSNLVGLLHQSWPSMVPMLDPPAIAFAF
jgi:hypothetical protein